MAKSYRDLVPQLRDKPALSFASHSQPLDVVLYQTDTVSADNLRGCPVEVEETVERTAVVTSADVAGSLNGLHFDTQDGDGNALAVYLDAEPWGDQEGSDRVVAKFEQDASATEVALAIADALRCAGSGLTAYEHEGKLVLDDGTGAFPGGWSAGDSGFTTITVEADVVVSNLPDTLNGRPAQIGDYHPDCEYLRLVDAWMSGRDDHLANWTFVYRVDLWKLAEDADDFSEADIPAEYKEVDHPYFDDSRQITEQFEILNPDSYVRKSQCSRHPCRKDALLMSDRLVQEGATSRVMRVYREISDQDSQSKFGFEVSYDCASVDDPYPLVTWSYETEKADYAPPLCGSPIPIEQGGLDYHNSGVDGALDFATLNLVLIEPPVYEAINPCMGRVTCRYGRIPGYMRETLRNDDDRGTITIYEGIVASGYSLPANGDTYEGSPVIDAELVEENCCAKKVRIVTGADETSKTDFLTHPEYCEIRRYRIVDTDGSSTLPALGDEYPALSGWYVIEAERIEAKSSGEVRLKILTAELPSEELVSQEEDEEMGIVYTYRQTFLASALTVPAIGDEYPVASGKTVISAETENAGCDKIVRRILRSLTLPTTPRCVEVDDDTYGTLWTCTFYDEPDEGFRAGDTWNGRIIIDAKEKAYIAGASHYTIRSFPAPSDWRSVSQEEAEVFARIDVSQKAVALGSVDDVLPAIGDAFNPTADAPAHGTTAGFVIDSRRKPITHGVNILVVTHCPVPTAFDDWESVAFRFPPIYRVRMAKEKIVPCRVSYEFSRDPTVDFTVGGEQEFSSSLPGAPDGVDINGVPLARQVHSSWRNLPDTLHDSVNIFDPSTSRAIPDLDTTIGPSSPSATAYIAMVSAQTEFIIHDTVERWKGDIFMHITRRVVAR